MIERRKRTFKIGVLYFYFLVQCFHFQIQIISFFNDKYFPQLKKSITSLKTINPPHEKYLIHCYKFMKLFWGEQGEAIYLNICKCHKVMSEEVIYNGNDDLIRIFNKDCPPPKNHFALEFRSFKFYTLSSTLDFISSVQTQK